MRSLSIKLIGAFALVVVLGAIITYAVARPNVASQFRLYVNQHGQLQAASWAPVFADFYAEEGGWSGIETSLSDLLVTATSPAMTGPGRGGPGYGRSESAGGASMGGRRGSGPPVQDHLILTDGDGRVVLDSEGERVDQILAPDDLTRGAPITVDGERVGTLLVVATETGAAAALADDFLAALNRGVLLAAVTAGLMALLLGAVLVRQIIAPLRGLQEAARAIADGDLSRRVMITSQDEIGDVGHSFNQMAVALEHNERVRRHTMADIAHELRTPLTVIQGQLEALLDGVFPLTAEQLAPIHDETLLLARLVADLRELALAEAGRLTIERSPVHLDDAVRRVATAVEPAASEKGIALGVDIAPNLSAACADADRLSQVLHNLLGNALRHTPSGGRVGISVRAFSPSELLVSVTDTGPGIPPADVPYIFDRFYRADKSRSRAGGGSGLGLTIARHIIESHGGRIWARSQLDEGTCIKFTLPIANSDSGTSREGFRVSET